MGHATNRRHRPETRPRTSDVYEIVGRSAADPDQTERSTPFAPSALDAARVLAELALERANRRDVETARAAIDDATVLLDAIDDASNAARVWIVVGEALLALDDARAARERLEAAFAILHEGDDPASAARALLGVARALRRHGDAGARGALEDAGILYEDLGDETMALAIDRELRELEAETDPAPPSFPSDRIPIRPKT